MDIQGNPLLSINGNAGSYITQNNGQQQSQPYPMLSTAGHDSYSHNSNVHAMYRPIDRRVEAQTRIRRKLDEAFAHPGSIFGIDVVAQLAKDILSLIESKPFAFGIPLVNLAMDAHALAYIALISCLYGFDENGRRKIKRSNVRELSRLLTSVHALLVEETVRKGIITRIKNVLGKRRRNFRVLRMQEELLDILRDIEKNENADILTSLGLALDCPYQ